MNVEIREDSVFISGYVNAVERLSKPIHQRTDGIVRRFLERIKAGVFRNALKRNNVLVLLNHNYERVLASTEDGNAFLEEDNIGLRAEITITDKEVVQKAREGKLSGWSFGFIANNDEMSKEGDEEIRTVTDMDLLEVSILDDTKSPAYYGTSIEAREGGAKVVEIRADAFTNEQTEEQTEETKNISIDELANLVAAKVIEALKTEEKAEEETIEETTEGEPEEQTEEAVEEMAEETEEQTEVENQEVEEENRSIDYSAFEKRLANVM